MVLFKSEVAEVALEKGVPTTLTKKRINIMATKTVAKKAPAKKAAVKKVVAKKAPAKKAPAKKAAKK